MDMSVHPGVRMQSQRRSRLQGAATAGMITMICLIAVPVQLFELGFASIGLSEILPVLAPPIGWPVRIALTLCVTAIAAILGAKSDEDEAPVRITGAGPGMERNANMGWTRSLGLHHLARLARGGESHAESFAPVAPKTHLAAVDGATQEPSPDLLPRRRGDMHPDAPPREPLIASRDLPTIPELTIVASAPERAVSLPPPGVSPIRDTTREIRPRPLPRSPAPLSESDLSWVRGMLDDAPVAPSETIAALPAKPFDPDAPTSLLSLVDRFEQGVTQRIALRDAADALDRVEGSQPAATSAGSTLFEAADDDASGSTPEMDDALNAALETLRKLSVKANAR